MEICGNMEKYRKMLRTASWVLDFPVHWKFEHLKSVSFYQHVVPIKKHDCEPWQLLELCTVGSDSAEARFQFRQGQWFHDLKYFFWASEGPFLVKIAK